MKQKSKYIVTSLFFMVNMLLAKEVHVIEEETHDIFFKNSGRVEAIQRADISAQTTGVVKYLGANISETFKKGDTLLKLSSIFQDAKVKEARHALENSQLDLAEKKRKYLRIKKLSEQHLAKREELTQRRTAYKRAKQTVAHAKENLVQMKELSSYTKVKAPFDGIVEQRHVRRAEKVSLGQALFSIYNKEKMRVVVTVPESELKKIKKYKKILVEVEEKVFEIDFKNIIIFPTSYNYAYTLRIVIPKKISPAFHDGNFVSVKFKIGDEKALYLDKKYIHSKHETSVVYLKKSEKVLMQYVRLGESNQEKIKVLSGLEVGDHVVGNAK